MTVATFYPDAHVESTSVDGYAGYATVGGAEYTWADIIAIAGNESDDASTSTLLAVYMTAGDGTNKWRYLYRGIILFDTSALGASVSITSAVLTLYGNTKADGLTILPNMNIYASTPQSDIALIPSDFQQVGSTPFCDTPITYDGFQDDGSPTGENNFTLNAAGLAAINKTGITKLSVRNANYDVSGTPPAWIAYQSSSMSIRPAGSAKPPKLVVTYTSAFIPKIIGII